jgi:hypothetical protein
VAAVIGHTRVGWCVGQAIFRVLASRRDFRSPAPVGSWCAGRGTTHPFGIDLGFALLGIWDVALSEECCRGVGDRC